LAWSLDPTISQEKLSKEDEGKLMDLVDSLAGPSWEMIA
jgi:hypothetical protein